MNMHASAIQFALKTILAVCALLSLLWPSNALYIFYRSREVSENRLYVSLFKIISLVAFAGLMFDLIVELFGIGR